jgi:hypothetical protein
MTFTTSVECVSETHRFIIHARSVAAVIADRVFPQPALPNAAHIFSEIGTKKGCVLRRSNHPTG